VAVAVVRERDEPGVGDDEIWNTSRNDSPGRMYFIGSARLPKYT